jgi:lactose/L-arabinose transport system substrate-binding protein
MVKLFKGSISLILVLVLTSAILVGCSTKTDEDTTTPDVADTQDVASDTEADAEVVVVKKPTGKIVVWTWDGAKNALDLNLEAFNAEYPDIEVVYEVMSNVDEYQKMIFGLSAGGEGLPDIVTIENSNLPQFLALGGLMDLTDKVEPYAANMNEFKITDATYEGKIYAMPWDSGPVALYYRTDVFENAGLPSDPEAVSQLLATWEDYKNTAKIIMDTTGVAMIV